MGVKGLYSYIHNNCQEYGNGLKRPLTYFEKKTVIIDVSIYMYKFKNNNHPTTYYFDELINHLLGLKCKVILVFDGDVKNEKLNEIETRKNQKETNVELIESLETKVKCIDDKLSIETEKHIIERLIIEQKTLNDELYRLKKSIVSISNEERRTIYRHLENTFYNNVSFVYEKHEEADTVISNLARQGRGKTVVMSDDTDMFLYGCPLVAMNYDPITKCVVVYDLMIILKCLGMQLSELIQVCIIVGTDYLSPFHKGSPLPKVSITQVVNKFRKFKTQCNRMVANKYSNTNHRRHYTDFIDFMCFVYWKNNNYCKITLNKKLWGIFDLFYKT